MKVLIINNIDENTFVAFLDISGFKNLMGENKAFKALTEFYKCGYSLIPNNNNTVQGFFVSDSGILFARNQDVRHSLISLLNLIRDINIEMLEKGYLLSCSIAYGHFKYKKMIDLDGIEKTPIYGEAYISAYLDNEKGKPKLKPGECRIVKKNFPDILNSELDNENNSSDIIRLLKSTNKHYYFYWMLNDYNDILSFKREYKKAYDSRYQVIKKLLKDKSRIT